MQALRVPFDLIKELSNYWNDLALYKYKVNGLLDLQVLDGVTMANLDVVWNVASQSTEGTLLDKLDQCSTAFGE